MRNITLLQVFRTHHVLDDDQTLYKFFDRCVCHVMRFDSWGVTVTDKLYEQADAESRDDYGWLIKPEAVAA